MIAPPASREIGIVLPASGATDRSWSLMCDEAMLVPGNLDCLAISLAFDGKEPLVKARLLAWQAIGNLKLDASQAFDGATLDVWAGQRCVEGAFVPQIVLAFHGLGDELTRSLRAQLEKDDTFVGEAAGVDPTAIGVFPVARVAEGRLTPRSLPVDFLLACSRRFRKAHQLPPWTRDPYSQVATGSSPPQEFAWVTSDGSIIDAEGGAIEVIDNARLVPTDVPAHDAPLPEVARFAATFDGFEEYGEYGAAVEVAQDVRARLQDGVDLTSEFTLRELRTALFIEKLKADGTTTTDDGFAATVLTAIRTSITRSREKTRSLRRPSDSTKPGSKEADAGSSSSHLSLADIPSLEEMEPDDQCTLAHESLLRSGPLEKGDAIRAFGNDLRERGRVSYQRLHQDGPLYALLEEIIEQCVKVGIVDRPRRGWVRAIIPDASEYSRDLWRHCLLGVVTTEPVDRDAAVRLAAEWAREQMGLAYERLREGGIIDRGLRSAMNSAVRRGEVVRVGSHSIQKPDPANPRNTERTRKPKKVIDETAADVTQKFESQRPLLPDLGTEWLQAGRENMTIEIDHIDLLMLARAGVGDYTSSRNINAERDYMLTLKFDEGRFQELLALLPGMVAAQLRKALGGSFVEPTAIEIPSGVVTISARTRLGQARLADGESYVPLEVTSMTASDRGVLSFTFHEERGECVGALELVQGESGASHAVCGTQLVAGDRIEAWLVQENGWVSGRYEPTTSAGGFETRFAALMTDSMGMRPIFLGIKVRLPPALAAGTTGSRSGRA
jgi:hypothetical protein